MRLTQVPFLIAGLAALFALAGCSDATEAKPAQTSRAVSVETAAVKTGPLEREVVAVGSLRSDESVVLSPEIAGRVTKIAFDEGQSVGAGALLVGLDDSVHRAELEQARANLALAKRNAARAAELASRGLVSASDRDATASQQELDQASYELAQAQLAKTRIAAPFAGRLGLRQVSPGDYVTPGQALVTLESTGRMKIEFRVPELALATLKEGQAVSVELDAYPEESFVGEVYAIDTRVNDETRSIALRARLDNRSGRLRPGQFARVRLVVDRKLEALTVPEEAVFPRGEQLFVYVVREGKAELREVELGVRQPGSAEVVSGLRAGESVVTSGHQNLSPGSAVQVASGAAAAPAPAATR